MKLFQRNIVIVIKKKPRKKSLSSKEKFNKMSITTIIPIIKVKIIKK
jgi:hypothetical protein